jgi:hypothetical protein
MVLFLNCSFDNFVADYAFFGEWDDFKEYDDFQLPGGFWCTWCEDGV